MAAFPSSKVHRTSRRNLGRGQHTQQPPVVATPTNVAAVVTVALSIPCVIRGPVDLGLTGVSLLSFVVVDSMTITQTYDSTVAGLDWTIKSTDPNVSSFQGGALAEASGSFP